MLNTALRFSAVLLLVTTGAAAQPAPGMEGITFEPKIIPNAGSVLGHTADEMELAIIVDIAKTGEFAVLDVDCGIFDRNGQHVTSDWTVVRRKDFKPYQGTSVRDFLRRPIVGERHAPVSGSAQARCTGVLRTDVSGIVFESKIFPNAGSFMGQTADELELAIIVDIATTGEFAFFTARCDYFDRDDGHVGGEITVIPRDNFTPYQGTSVREFSRNAIMASGSVDARCTGKLDR
jgi:hypothetical protein